MENGILETVDLTKEFVGVRAVDRFSYTFPKGSLTAVIGPNGAGKTTLFNVITGYHKPTSGRIFFKGQDITTDPPSKRARMGLGRSFQITNLFDGLTTHDNIRVSLQTTHKRHRYNFWQNYEDITEIADSADDLLDRIGLAHQQDVPAGDLSYGQRRLLEIGIIIAIDPDVILLDEPSQGLSPQNTEEMISLIEELAVDHTIVFIEHNMEFVDRITDHVIVMNRGEILSVGSVDEVKTDQQVREVYLDSG